jgi:hypothetical protein
VARITLEWQNKELKIKLLELETSQRTKAKATITTLGSKSHSLEDQRQARSRKVLIIAAAAADRLDRTSLRREQLADNDVGQILQDVEAGQRSEWNDTADRVPFTKAAVSSETPTQ